MSERSTDWEHRSWYRVGDKQFCNVRLAGEYASATGQSIEQLYERRQYEWRTITA